MRNLLLICCCLLAGGHAAAACSRPIVVPASSLGRTVLVDSSTEAISGIYPDLLREYGKAMGCEFRFVPMPWARAEWMVKNGEADLLLPAMQVPERDAWGRFVAMVGSDWTLVSLRNETPPRSVDELLAKPDIRVNVVRSFKYGSQYQSMLDRLAKRNALEYVRDPGIIARKMAAGRVDYAFLPSYSFAVALEQQGLKRQYGAQVHYSHLDGIPTAVSGVYLSPRLSAGDAEQLMALLEHIRDDGEILKRMRTFFTLVTAPDAAYFSKPALPGSGIFHATSHDSAHMNVTYQ